MTPAASIRAGCTSDVRGDRLGHQLRRAFEMGGRWWRSWTNNPTSGSISMNSAKQEQEISSDCLSTRKKVRLHRTCPVVGLSTLCLLLLVTCVALSVSYNYRSNSRTERKSLLFDYQNISEGYLTLIEANNDLRGENDILKERHALLEERNELLNRTSAKLTSFNLALSLESALLMEQIANLTSTNSQLAEEHERLVQHMSEQEEEKQNMSTTIKHLVDSNAQRQEEKRRLSEVNSLLRDELSQVEESNQEYLQIHNECRGEIRNLSEQIGALLNRECDEASDRSVQVLERVAELQEQNQNLSRMMMRERQEVEEREDKRRNEIDRMVADIHSMKEAYHSLDLYCPVVNLETKERICKKCQDSWRLFENKCYHFSSLTLTWNSSRAWCLTQGADLVVIDSEPEQNFIFETSLALDQSGTRLWIGMTDGEEEGEWFWVDGSSVASDTQFWLSRPGMKAEPDDWKLNNPLGEDCGHIDTRENIIMSWLDGPCNAPYRWICENNI